LPGFGSFGNENGDAVALIDTSFIEGACLELGGHQIGDAVAMGQALTGCRPSLTPHLRGDLLQ
jgi:hypothetical protein